MSLLNIQAALYRSYEQGGFSLPTHFENMDFERPSPTQAWARVHMIPNQPSVGSLGVEGQDEHDGVFQIDLNFPLDEGTLKSVQKADEIRKHYVAGKRYLYDGQAVLIKSCGLSTGRKVDGWYRTVITVYWYARTYRIH